MLLASLGDLSELAGTTTTLLLFVFAIVNVAVLVLRPDPGTHPHFRAPSVIPVASVVIIVFLLVRRASDNPEYFAYAGALVALGVVLVRRPAPDVTLGDGPPVARRPACRSPPAAP